MNFKLLVTVPKICTLLLHSLLKTLFQGCCFGLVFPASLSLGQVFKQVTLIVLWSYNLHTYIQEHKMGTYTFRFEHVRGLCYNAAAAVFVKPALKFQSLNFLMKHTHTYMYGQYNKVA